MTEYYQQIKFRHRAKSISEFNYKEAMVKDIAHLLGIIDQLEQKFGPSCIAEAEAGYLMRDKQISLPTQNYSQKVIRDPMDF